LREEREGKKEGGGGSDTEGALSRAGTCFILKEERDKEGKKDLLYRKRRIGFLGARANTKPSRGRGLPGWVGDGERGPPKKRRRWKERKNDKPNHSIPLEKKREWTILY